MAATGASAARWVRLALVAGAARAVGVAPAALAVSSELQVKVA